MSGVQRQIFYRNATVMYRTSYFYENTFCWWAEHISY